MATMVRDSRNKIASSIAPQTFDVVVIGGGPAGMMAASQAAARGKKVLLLEKNDTLGKKLLITGGGRCNVTNAEFDTRALLKKFGGNDKFLFSAFSQWDVSKTLDFFHEHSMETKTEAEKRVFPVSNSAQSVWNVLVADLKKNGVTVQSNSPVAGFVTTPDSKKILAVRLKDSTTIEAASFILATGGQSRPETGSTGDGFVFLKQLGHTVIDASAALVPITLDAPWTTQLAGVSLQNAKITTFQNDVKQESRAGKILFTHVGLSGPTILNMSRDIGELLKYDRVTIEIDLLPQHDYSTLNTALQEIFKTNHTKKIKNSLHKNGLLPAALTPVVLELAGVNPDTFCNSITREERLALVKTLKHLSANVSGLLGTEKAVVTSGGVSLDEVDFKTMRSRLVENLYLVGDILNIDRPSGGYSLQLCWTTGYVAGTAARGK